MADAEGAGLLKLTIKQHGAQGEGDGPIHECAALDEHGWDSLIQHCIDLSSLTFLVSRDILQQKSSFFRSLLGGDFRESVENHVNITWDPLTFCCLLQCLYSGKLQIPSDLECFLEGILFFGVETAMVSLLERINGEGPRKWVPKLWNIAKGLGQCLLEEACIEAFAINFGSGTHYSSENEMKKRDFQDLSAGFLTACMEHKQLTVSSEQFLCEAILHWMLSKEKTKACSIETLPTCNVHLSEAYGITCFGDRCLQYQEDYIIDSDKTISNIFHKVKILLLPLEYILGSLAHDCPANMFHMKAAELTAYDELFLFHEEIATKSIQQLQAAYGDEITLRITKNTKKLDLAGCHQVTVAVLFQGLLQLARKTCCNDWASYSKLEKQVLTILRGEMLTSTSSDQDGRREMTLESLYEVHLQRCWRLKQSSLVAWLDVACPNLKLLDISYCPQLDFSILLQSCVSCKSLEKVKMALYFNCLQAKCRILQRGVHSAHHSSIQYSGSILFRIYSTSLASLKILSLEGRSSLKDSHLDFLARFCFKLTAINLRGCVELTDRGLAQLLANLKSLVVLEAAYTAFGELCGNALLSNVVAASSEHSGNIFPLEMSHDTDFKICKLTTLDLEGCSSVNNISVARLLKKSPFLKYLNLGFTRVDDSVILNFGGSLLKELNLRETEVTECSVAHILKWNQELENLNIQGCRNLAVSSALETTVAPLEDYTCNIPKGLSLKLLAFGWGFSDSTFQAWKSSLCCLQSLSLGLGGRISEGLLSTLHASSPQLKHLALTFQVVSDSSLGSLLRNLPMLQTLELHHCLGDISRQIIGTMPTSLTKLCLERGVAWLTDGDMELLGSACRALTSISFTGCTLLTPKSLHTLCKNWQGMTNLVLKECGAITSDGGSCLFICKALRQLTLQHSGSGLSKDFAEYAHVELPLLQELCLDICDSKDGGFNSINAYKRSSLVVLIFRRCATLRNIVNGYTRQYYKDSVFIEWLDNQERSIVINEGF